MGDRALSRLSHNLLQSISAYWS